MSELEVPRGPDTMSPELADAKNYYRWVFDRIAPYLGDRILDIGGGYGSHLDPIVRSGRRVLSVDHSPEATEWMESRFGDQSGFETLCADFDAEETRRELLARDFDTIVCLNVLEHIEDDLAALKGMGAILGKGGTLVLQIPAHPRLYGRLDSLAGHYRRYTASGMEKLLTAAGFDNLRIEYFNRFGVLPWLINGRLFKPKRMDTEGVGLQVRIFDHYLVPVARLVDAVLRLPFGQSLIAIARFPGGLAC